MEDVRDAPEGGTFSPVQGGVNVAYALGTDTGETGSEWLAEGAMPVGTPMDMEVVVQDETGDTLEMADFTAHYGATPLGDPVDGLYRYQVHLAATSQSHPRSKPCDGECPYDCFQRVSIDDLTTGQTWSQDVASVGCDSCGEPPAGNGDLTFAARRGDRLRVRRNVLTLGYVAVLGSGITVLDLNRFYRLPSPPSTPLNRAQQCGRRLGSYEGQQLDLSGCVPGLSQGISLTPSVAPLARPAIPGASSTARGCSPPTPRCCTPACSRPRPAWPSPGASPASARSASATSTSAPSTPRAGASGRAPPRPPCATSPPPPT